MDSRFYKAGVCHVQGDGAVVGERGAARDSVDASSYGGDDLSCSGGVVSESIGVSARENPPISAAIIGSSKNLDFLNLTSFCGVDPGPL